MNARRICLVTPGALGSNPRIVKEADALHAAGYDVSVISMRTLDRVDIRDEALLRRVGWRSVRIDFRARRVWRRWRLQQIAARGLFAMTGLPALGDHAFSPFTAMLTRAALRNPADLYIAHYPAALPAAAAAAKAHGARYAYDAEDYHLGDWPDDAAHDPDRRLVKHIEARYLPACAYITAASPGIAQAYARAYGVARPVVILNVFPRVQAPAAQTPAGSAALWPSVYWFSQTIGPDRGLECAVEAMARARAKPHLYLRGSLTAGFDKRLRELAARCGVDGRLHFLPPAAPDDLERLAAAYDLGLVAEIGQTAARQLCLTNKLFSFLLAGVAPLMSDTPEHRAFAAQVGLEDHLFPVGDAERLAALFDSFLESPQRLAAARAKSWRLAQESCNWDVEQTKLTQLVSDAFAFSARSDEQAF